MGRVAYPPAVQTQRYKSAQRYAIFTLAIDYDGQAFGQGTFLFRPLRAHNKTMIPLTRRWRADLPSRVVPPWLLFGLCFALGAVSIFQFPLNHDVAWGLAMAKQVRGGARLYVDILELNPPLIVWLNMPVSAAAEWLHVAPGTVFRVVVLALALASIAVVAAVLMSHESMRTWQLLSSPLCYAAVALAGYDFGQREHLASILALPYLAMALPRLNGESTQRSWRLFAAALAAIGFAIKPFFLLVPMLIEGLVVMQTRRRPDGSGYLIASVMVLYLVAVLQFTPEYLPLATMVSRVYGAGYLGIGPFDFLLAPNFRLAVICAVFAWIVRPPPRGMLCILSAAALGFAGAALIQQKGWNYHWYPAAAMSWLLFGLAGAEVAARQNRVSTAALPSLVGIVMVCLSALALAVAPHKGELENPIPPLFTPVIRELGGGPVMVFSNALRVAYPLVSQPGIGSSSRLPTVVLLSAAINARQPVFEKYLRDAIVADMVSKPPNLLIAEVAPWGLAPSLDFITYLSRDPLFARELSSFRVVREVAGFRFYQRVLPPPVAPVTLGRRDNGE